MTAQDSIVVDPDADQAPRCRPGERVHQLFEAVVDGLAAQGRGGDLAVDGADGIQLSYLELEQEANRLAHLLRDAGVQPGEMVALLLDDPVLTYPALLGVHKALAVVVALDAGLDPETLATLCDEAGVGTVITAGRPAEEFDGDLRVIDLAEVAGELTSFSDKRLDAADEGIDGLASVHYRACGTGRPVGVVVEHAALVNAVRVADQCYGLTGADRLFQAAPLHDPASTEELWLTWLAGAALVPRPLGPALSGEEWAAFLAAQHVSALCCDAASLAGVPNDLAELRFVLIRDVDCPPALVERWWSSERRLLHTYGLPETTTSALWERLEPSAEITLGRPLPSFRAMVLDPDNHQVLDPALPGELAIGGDSLAQGYLNRDDLTEANFVPDPADLSQTHARLYLSGRRACLLADGRVRDLGPIERPSTGSAGAPHAAEAGALESASSPRRMAAPDPIVTPEPIAASTQPAATSAQEPPQTSQERLDPAPRRAATEPIGTHLPRLAYALTGLAQVTAALVGLLVVSQVAVGVYRFVSDGTGVLENYLRAVAATAVVVAAWAIVSVAGKWLLVGRLRPGRIRLWTLDHLRFWLAGRFVRGSVFALLPGTEWQRLHLRACGARIGAGSLLLGHTPACPDLIEIGERTVVGSDTRLPGYRPTFGELELARVHLGSDVVVGEGCVLDAGSGMGDSARLAAASGLQPGQWVPDGQTWHGSPARSSDHRLPALPVLSQDAPASTTARRWLHAGLQLVALIAGRGGLSVTVVTLLLRALLDQKLPGIAVPGSAATPVALVGGPILLAGVLLLAGLAASLLLTTLAPRLVERHLPTGEIAPLPGWRWDALRFVRRYSNNPAWARIAGDSVFAASYLSALGWQIDVRERGSFSIGRSQRHDSPFAITVGAGATLGDRLRVHGCESSWDAFRLRHAVIGDRCVLGEEIGWPAGARVGADCTLATKVAVPVTGATRTGVGLQGSPSVETTPQAVPDAVPEVPAGQRAGRLADKARHDLASIALLLGTHWLAAALVLLLAQWLVLLSLPPLATTFWVLIGALVVASAVVVGAERLVLRAAGLQPGTYPLLDQRFWRHQRYRKLSVTAPLDALAGTPLRPWLLRLLGASIGACVFDDGCRIDDRSLVAIGDGACLGEGSTIQAHVRDTEVFTSDRVDVGPAAVLGVGSYVGPGMRLGERANLGSDSVLTHATVLSPNSYWVGNPAEPTQVPHDELWLAEGAGAHGMLPSRVPVDVGTTPVGTASPGGAPVSTTPATTRPDPPPGGSSFRPIDRPEAGEPVLAPEPAPPQPQTSSAPTTSRPQADQPVRPVSADVPDVEQLGLEGTDLVAGLVELKLPKARVAVLDLSDTELERLDDPIALIRFGVPASYLEEDLDSGHGTGVRRTRSALGRVLLRQLLSTAEADAHPAHEWRFIRSAAGGLRVFWPTNVPGVSLAHTAVAVAAATATGPVGVDLRPELTAAEASALAGRPLGLTPSERLLLAHAEPTQVPALLTQVLALKESAFKALGWGDAVAAEDLDTSVARGTIQLDSSYGLSARLIGSVQPLELGGRRFWLAVARQEP